LPQLAVVLPATHWLFWQQPLAHDEPSQTQAPARQRWPVLQAAHWPPAAPHEESDVPLTQALPMQQPFGHDCGLQVHAPPTHAWPKPHWTQAPPPVPQALC
jgi:hypothetical protein